MAPILFALAAMAAAMLAHIALLRAGAGAVRAYGSSLAIGLVVAAGLAWQAGTWDATITTLLLFGAWWFVFLNFVQSSQSSLRVNLLREIQARGGTMPKDMLLARYNDRSLTELRLARLLDGGTIVETDGRYHVVSGQARLLARLFRGLKIAIMGVHSEFTPAPDR